MGIEESNDKLHLYRYRGIDDRTAIVAGKGNPDAWLNLLRNFPDFDPGRTVRQFADDEIVTIDGVTVGNATGPISGTAAAVATVLSKHGIVIVGPSVKFPLPESANKSAERYPKVGIPIRQTRTIATLEVSAGTYNEIAAKLTAAGYGQPFADDGTIDMHGIGLTRGKEPAIDRACIGVGGVSYEFSPDRRPARMTVEIDLAGGTAKVTTAANVYNFRRAESVDAFTGERVELPSKRIKHTCGVDGDPGASAPLDGTCEACAAAVREEWVGNAPPNGKNPRSTLSKIKADPLDIADEREYRFDYWPNESRTDKSIVVTGAAAAKKQARDFGLSGGFLPVFDEWVETCKIDDATKRGNVPRERRTPDNANFVVTRIK